MNPSLPMEIHFVLLRVTTCLELKWNWVKEVVGKETTHSLRINSRDVGVVKGIPVNCKWFHNEDTEQRGLMTVRRSTNSVDWNLRKERKTAPASNLN